MSSFSAIRPAGVPVAYRTDNFTLHLMVHTSDAWSIGGSPTFWIYTLPLATPGVTTKTNRRAWRKSHHRLRLRSGQQRRQLCGQAADGGLDQLYRVQTDSHGVALRLNRVVGPVWAMAECHIRPEGAHVAYVANQRDADIYELYDKEFASRGLPTKLRMHRAGDRSARVRAHSLWRACDQATGQDSGPAEIFLVDGSNPGVSTQLNGNMTAGSAIWGFHYFPHAKLELFLVPCTSTRARDFLFGGG